MRPRRDLTIALAEGVIEAVQNIPSDVEGARTRGIKGFVWRLILRIEFTKLGIIQGVLQLESCPFRLRDDFRSRLLF